ncbi:hypothetical protein KCP75_00220 [Salmonella enterica subsp. enterica]|nr:hypothetical protein KCP75_00220 [Salmonella enterica subsp. enterica]
MRQRTVRSSAPTVVAPDAPDLLTVESSFAKICSFVGVGVLVARFVSATGSYLSHA